MTSQPTRIGREATTAEELQLIEDLRDFEPVRRITCEHAAALRDHIDKAGKP